MGVKQCNYCPVWITLATFHSNGLTYIDGLHTQYHETSRSSMRGSARETNSKNPRLLWKWVGGSKSHSDFFENRPKLALNQW